LAIEELNLITDVVQELAQPIEGAAHDYGSLLKLIGEARFCLLGEATMARMSSIATARK